MNENPEVGMFWLLCLREVVIETAVHIKCKQTFPFFLLGGGGGGMTQTRKNRNQSAKRCQ